MILPYFASFIVFIILIAYEIRKNTKIARIQEESFWDRETRANSTRKKPLDALPYVRIPLDALPFQIMSEDPRILELHQAVQNLAEKKIVNLTGLTNTDLKLKYGAANLTTLSQYDQDYTMLARTLQKWALLLYENGYLNEAQQILEFAVSTRTDVSGSYRLLASIYHQTGYTSKINDLIETAKTLQSVMKNPIVRMLQEFDPYNDSPHSL
ncbi:MAG: hypothetical protein PHT89_01790 [Lachnospiraceae bacterium]|nr:hypothetical protein [Lachnospiraceae bacterium]MDD3659436.1 hypothetical protein [Lachnospiraceae bacterium]